MSKNKSSNSAASSTAKKSVSPQFTLPAKAPKIEDARWLLVDAKDTKLAYYASRSEARNIKRTSSEYRIFDRLNKTYTS